MAGWWLGQAAASGGREHVAWGCFRTSSCTAGGFQGLSMPGAISATRQPAAWPWLLPLHGPCPDAPPCLLPPLRNQAGTKVVHILTSAVFLAAPGLVAWAIDWGWRREIDPLSAQLPPLAQLLPAWAWAGAVAGGSGAAGGSGRSKDEIAREARALAVLRASGAAQAESGGSAALANAKQQQGNAARGFEGEPESAPAAATPRGQLRPFVELAYGEERMTPVELAGVIAGGPCL